MEIGSTLREARTRARIDISEIEAETKIRAKYLRALENEEWNLLPGPTYVRSFLRTYAEALDLDAKLLLEEYKLRHEDPSDHDLMPIAPPGRRQAAQRGRGRPRRGVPTWAVVGVIAVGILAALYALGRNGGGDDGDDGTPAATATKPTRTTITRAKPLSAAQRRRRAERRRRAAARAKIVRLQVLPTGPGPVFVCLEAAGDRRLIPGANLPPTSSATTYRSSQFRVTLGNGNVRLRIDGRVRDVPEVRNGVGYDITKKRVRTLSAAARPSCVR
jgi:cytoskeleton protein RodZ